MLVYCDKNMSSFLKFQFLSRKEEIVTTFNYSERYKDDKVQVCTVQFAKLG